ncbi:hypothetical protein UlMin_043091 [Ulmus minor]
MKGNFEFRTRKSNRSLWVIECIDPNCSWRLRASKIVPESTKFVIRKYVGVHCCSLLNRNANHRQATYVVIGEQVAPQYVGVEKGPGPKGVQTFARMKLGAQISYYKAWRGRKHAHTLIRGSPEQSFHILPSYFHMLKKLNPGTYLFLAFGVAIRGFRYMRKVVEIDGTFLKGQYREVIGDTDELALISDRAPSIKKAISTVFEKAHHGACAWHVAQNIKNKFKCADIMGSYWSAVNAYRCEDFAGYMTEISHRYPRVAEYLENEVGFEKWSRCHYPGLSLVSPYYTKEYYVLAYGETIYPVGSQSQWDVPNEVATRVVLPREVKERKKGRPKTSRFPSVGEFRKRKNCCGKCGA